jgi:hypothetical protein
VTTHHREIGAELVCERRDALGGVTLFELRVDVEPRGLGGLLLESLEVRTRLLSTDLPAARVRLKTRGPQRLEDEEDVTSLLRIRKRDRVAERDVREGRVIQADENAPKGRASHGSIRPSLELPVASPRLDADLTRALLRDVLAGSRTRSPEAFLM